MIGIKLNRFGGEAPRVAPRLLPDGYAQIARNCKLTSGALIPYRKPQRILAASIPAAQTLFPFSEAGTYYWMMWATDVDVVRAAVAGVTNTRIYYTGDGVPKTTDIARATFRETDDKVANYTLVTGDYQRTIRYATAPFNVTAFLASTTGQQWAVVIHNAAASGNITIVRSGADTINGGTSFTVLPGQKVLLKTISTTAWAAGVVTQYPYDHFDLGLPAPTVAPTVAYDSLPKAALYTVVLADSGKTIDCTATPWTLTLSAAATLTAAFIVVVRNLGTGDLTVNTTGGELINGAASLVIKSGEVGVITCNGTAFGASTITSGFKTWVYTWVSEWGEQSKPSASSALLVHTSGQRVVVSGLPTAPPAGNHNIKKLRLYRTNSGSRGTFYQFVTEITLLGSSGTYTDNVVDSGLGEVLESTFFDPPPSDLKGIINLTNGMTAGFRGNELCFSEPNKPNAWPPAYRYATDTPIVALGAVGNSVVVATQGRPYLASGNHPSSVTMRLLDVPYPCVSKRSMVNMGAGVLYASYEGLVYVSGVAPRLATAQLMTRDEWREFYPATMYGRFYDGKYFGHFTRPDGTRESFIFQSASDRLPLLVRTDIYADAGYSDLTTGEFFFVLGPDLELWDHPDEPYAVQDWQSKEYSLAKPSNLGAARIYGRTDVDPEAALAAIIAANEALTDLGGDIAGGDVASLEVAGDLLRPLITASQSVLFQVYVDGSLYWQRFVALNTTFRLPTGFRADTWSFRVSAALDIDSVLIAETPYQLEQLDAA